MAAKAHKPTDAQRRQVLAMAGYGIPQDDIACVIEIAPQTLRKYYKTELATGATKANAKVAEFLYQAACGAAIKNGANYADCIRAAMFWGKTRMGMRETNALELSGKDGAPLPQIVVVTGKKSPADGG
jgi:hypothetical protein